MTGENFKRFHYAGKQKKTIKVSENKEKEIRSKIRKLRNELDKEWLDLTISDKYLEDKENEISKLIDSLY